MSHSWYLTRFELEKDLPALIPKRDFIVAQNVVYYIEPEERVDAQPDFPALKVDKYLGATQALACYDAYYKGSHVPVRVFYDDGGVRMSNTRLILPAIAWLILPALRAEKILAVDVAAYTPNGKNYSVVIVCVETDKCFRLYSFKLETTRIMFYVARSSITRLRAKAVRTHLGLIIASKFSTMLLSETEGIQSTNLLDMADVEELEGGGSFEN